MAREYDRVTFHGKPTDHRTAVMARLVEKRCDVTFVCWQGSYNAGDLSAGTHLGGGALDLDLPADPQMLVRVLRKQGFAAWYRGPGSGFDPHIHAIDIGNRRLSGPAQDQVAKYEAGCDGLSGWNDDPQPFRPPPYAPFVNAQGFDYRSWKESLTLRAKIGNLSDRIKELIRQREQAKRTLGRLS